MGNRIYKIDLDYEKDIFGYRPMETINYILQNKPHLIEVYFKFNQNKEFNKERKTFPKRLILHKLEFLSVSPRDKSTVPIDELC